MAALNGAIDRDANFISVTGSSALDNPWLAQIDAEFVEVIGGSKPLPGSPSTQTYEVRRGVFGTVRKAHATEAPVTPVVPVVQTGAPAAAAAAVSVPVAANVALIDTPSGDAETTANAIIEALVDAGLMAEAEE